ncbi:hypothetical protein [Demequina iriomotensis]|uniref:hypothetical protein n=1 Tax=Demequina iriomotensis TaxID=1536641 RepID=UPI0007805829|nr:hypothetical protein [Demequina iriomotensis]
MNLLRASALAGAVMLVTAGAAVIATAPSGELAPGVDPPMGVVNVSCGTQMNLDLTYGTPDNPEDGFNSWLFDWSFDVYIDGEYLTTLDDEDGDLRGFHGVVAADQLPDVNYTWSVDAHYGEELFPGAFSGEVVCTVEVTPQEPTLTDPCGPDNASWTLPEPGEGYTYETSTDGDLLIVTAIAADGYSFADGATTVTWTGTDSGVACDVVVEPTPEPTDDGGTDVGGVDGGGGSGVAGVGGADPVPGTAGYTG